MLYKIESRIQQAKNNQLLFGGISVILIGDPGQLLPVLATPLYDQTIKTGFSFKGFEAYKMFKTAVKFKKMVRQQNLTNCPKQQKFIELLARLRNGESTVDDWKLLLERSTTPEKLRNFENAIRLCDLNESVDSYNKNKLETLCQQITKICAINTNNAKNANSDFFLASEILCIWH